MNVANNLLFGVSDSDRSHLIIKIPNVEYHTNQISDDAAYVKGQIIGVFVGIPVILCRF